jgi:DNA-binding PadR family transcriptional regulator
VPTDKDLIGASTTLLLLAALQDGPSYGYQLVERINAKADGVLTWQEGTIYPVLHRLEKQRLIGAQWKPAAKGSARKRKYYTLTAKGKSHLAAAATRWNALHALVAHFTGAAYATRKALRSGKPRPAVA